ncbi:recombinase family protein, partial [Clavibacter michiganensis]|uniref:recombinase family protein n=1 Tax=Clavibacter michiganensis TaxID=28447 RepID=UPI001365B3AA
MTTTTALKNGRYKGKDCTQRTKPIVIGYARVSSAGQSTAIQQEALTKSGCDELFVDEGVSGTKNHRSPNFRAMIARVKDLRDAGFAVTVRVTRQDRFSRTTQYMLQNVGELGALGASFEAIDGGFSYDATSPHSHFMLTVMSAVAELDRQMLKARMAEGMEAVRAKGMILGRR